jgi:hypothetical protein
MHIKEIIKKSFSECSDIVFPRICLHCKKQISNNFFCELCLSNFELLEREEMKNYSSIKYKTIITFDEIGPISTFYVELKRMALPSLTKVAASYMVCQFLRYESALPDIVVPASESFFGVQYINVVSKEIGKLINRPIKKLFSTLTIPFLSKCSYLKQSSLQAKHILLVMGKFDERKTLEVISQLENRGFKNISILAFCR